MSLIQHLSTRSLRFSKTHTPRLSIRSMTRSSTKIPKPCLSEFYCHSCGRHASFRRSHLDAFQSATPPKYCSKRCRSKGKPGLELVVAWRRMLDDGERDRGKEKAVMCSEVEMNVYDPALGQMRGSEVAERDQKEHPVDLQALGMLNARNREKVRKVARLIVHFGFEHFGGGSLGEEEKEDADVVWKEERKVQPVQGGKVLEDVTHAKGEWGLRWAENGAGS